MERRHNQTALGPPKLCTSRAVWPHRWPLSLGPLFSSLLAKHWLLFKVHELISTFSSILSLTISPHPIFTSNHLEMSQCFSNISDFFTIWPLYFLSHCCPATSSVFMSHLRLLFLVLRALLILNAYSIPGQSSLYYLFLLNYLSDLTVRDFRAGMVFYSPWCLSSQCNTVPGELKILECVNKRMDGQMEEWKDD